MKDDNDLLRELGPDNLDPERDLVPAEDQEALRKEAEQQASLKEFTEFRIDSFCERAVQQLRGRLDGHEVPVKTPWLQLNLALRGGLWPGLHVLTGAPGTGKSQWVLQITEAACLANVPVLYVGLELDELGIFTRLLGLRAGCQWSNLYLAQDQALVENALEHYSHEFRSWPLYFEPSPPMGWDHENLYRRVETMRALHPTGPILLIVDYLQLVSGPERDLRERIRGAAYGARAAARDLRATVLLISSIAREQYKAINGSQLPPSEPTKTEDSRGFPSIAATRFIGLGKESGEIEYAADTVMAMCRNTHDDPDTDIIDIAIAKLRAGVPSWVSLKFDGARFYELSERTQPEVFEV